MIITKDFIDGLKNFSSITTQIMFIEGTVQSIFVPERGIFASLKTDIEIDKSFGIYDLSKFLNIINLFIEPEIEINNKTVRIFSNSEKKEVEYQLSNHIVYETNTEKYKNMINEVSFDMNFSDFSDINKAAHILNSKNLIFQGNGKRIILKISNENDNGDSASLEIGESNKVFKAIIDRDKLKLMNKNYNIRISKKKAIHFSSDVVDYYMTMDKSSEI